MKLVINTFFFSGSCFIRADKKISNITLHENATKPCPGFAYNCQEWMRDRLSYLQ